ncbi:MAG: TolC family protein, partial [Planctomycetota bacterium]
MNPSITQNETEIKQPIISTKKSDKPKKGTKQNSISTVSHDTSASDFDETESVKLVNAEEPLNPTSLKSVQAPTVNEQSALGSGMSLQELESIALANNPAIQELAASTQKAAGYRTQVTTRPNPMIGYQGQQLADRGTDQHLAFVEREFVTANKLELNNRVLNATLSAQLQELE